MAPAMPSTGSPDVALEFAERGRGQVTEDAVHPPGVEAEGTQTLLELGDVVAPQHRGAAVEEAVAQLAPGLDQGRPGLWPAHAVDPETPAILERLDGGPGPGPGSALLVDAGREAEALSRRWTSATAGPLSPTRVGSRRSSPASDSRP